MGLTQLSPVTASRNGTLSYSLSYITQLPILIYPPVFLPSFLCLLDDKTLENSTYNHQLSNKHIGLQELCFFAISISVATSAFLEGVPSVSGHLVVY